VASELGVSRRTVFRLSKVRDAELAAEADNGVTQVSINGANGVGKDWTIGEIIVPWWMAAHAAPCPRCRSVEQGKRWSPQCKVVVTGPTFRQVTEIVWRETRQAYNNSKTPLGGRMLPGAAKWDAETSISRWVSRLTAPGTSPAFTRRTCWSSSLRRTTSPKTRWWAIKRLHPEVLLLSGNPFSQSGEFFDSHHSKRHLYRPITITAHDSPNVRAGDEHVPGVVSQRDIDKMAEDWGKDSPFYRATVDAEFAETEDGLLPLSWLQAAQERPAVEGTGELVAGIDVAGPGEDETVLTVREGNSIILQKAWRIPDPRGETIDALNPYRNRLKLVNVDSAGIGYYFAQHLSDDGFNVCFVNVGAAAFDKEHFANLKAELYWGLRLRFKDGHVAGLVNEKSISQLASIRYGHNARGQVQIERKEDAKKRGVPSPDYGESIMLAFALDQAPPHEGVYEYTDRVAISPF
jgi:phage terminase large subunit